MRLFCWCQWSNTCLNFSSYITKIGVEFGFNSRWGNIITCECIFKICVQTSGMPVPAAMTVSGTISGSVLGPVNLQNPQQTATTATATLYYGKPTKAAVWELQFAAS